MYKALIIALCLALGGCPINDRVIPGETISHPRWPAPIETRDVKNKVIVLDDEVYVAKTYEDDLEYQKYQEDVFRYIIDLKSTVCFYRSSLNESECKKGNSE